jgi:hypothetical protein
LDEFLPKKKLKPEQVRHMNRKFWLVVSIGTIVLLILTLIDLHFLDLTYFEPH